MMMMFQDERLKPLYDKRAEITAKIEEIEEAEASKTTSELLGKCYRTQNNYSCPESDDDYWWLYSKVVATDGRALTVFQFERTSLNEALVRPEQHRYWSMDGHEEISESEFRKAWLQFVTELGMAFPSTT